MSVWLEMQMISRNIYWPLSRSASVYQEVLEIWKQYDDGNREFLSGLSAIRLGRFSQRLYFLVEDIVTTIEEQYFHRIDGMETFSIFDRISRCLPVNLHMKKCLDQATSLMAERWNLRRLRLHEGEEVSEG